MMKIDLTLMCITDKESKVLSDIIMRSNARKQIMLDKAKRKRNRKRVNFKTFDGLTVSFLLEGKYTRFGDRPIFSPNELEAAKEKVKKEGYEEGYEAGFDSGVESRGGSTC